MSLWWVLVSTLFAGHMPTEVPDAVACVPCAQSRVLLPSPEGGEVPPDGRMLVCLREADMHWVGLWRLTPSGERVEEPVALSLERFAFEEPGQAADVRWVVPVEPLEPRTRYELVVDGVTRTFETGADEAREPPALSEVTLVGPADPECSVNQVHTLSVQGADADESHVIYHVVVEAETANGWLVMDERVIVTSSEEAAAPTMALSACRSKLLDRPVRARVRRVGAHGVASDAVASNEVVVARGALHGSCHDNGGCAAAPEQGDGHPDWVLVVLVMLGVGVLGRRRRRLRRGASAVAALGLVMAGAVDVRASCDGPTRCPCARPGLGFPIRSSALEVPTNLKLLHPGPADGATPELGLWEADPLAGDDAFRPGRRIPLTIVPHDGTGAFWVSPEEELATGRYYLLEARGEMATQTLWLLATERDEEAPALEGLRPGSNLALVNCGDAAWVDIDHVADERTSEDDLVLELVVEGPSEVRRLVSRGDVRRRFGTIWSCVASFVLGPMEVERVVVTVYDLAGNAATSGPIALTLGPTPVAPGPPCGACQASGGDDQGFAAACVLAALGMLGAHGRRRRSGGRSTGRSGVPESRTGSRTSRAD